MIFPHTRIKTIDIIYRSITIFLDAKSKTECRLQRYIAEGYKLD
jgi:hypothetical protein